MINLGNKMIRASLPFYSLKMFKAITTWFSNLIHPTVNDTYVRLDNTPRHVLLIVDSSDESSDSDSETRLHEAKQYALKTAHLHSEVKYLEQYDK